MNIQVDHHAGGQSESQSDDFDEGIAPLFQQVPDPEDEVTFKHRQRLDVNHCQFRCHDRNTADKMQNPRFCGGCLGVSERECPNAGIGYKLQVASLPHWFFNNSEFFGHKALPVGTNFWC